MIVETGTLAPFARLWIRRAIPLFGRLSPDPTAYRCLAAGELDECRALVRSRGGALQVLGAAEGLTLTV